MIDIHNHIVPGVDDGARDIETSLQLLHAEAEAGVTAAILTPHYRKGMFETGTEKILTAYARLLEQAKAVLPRMELYLGCEVHAHMDIIETVQSHARFRMANSSFVLTEFSSRHDARYIRDILYAMRAEGMTPIIAHTERYPALTEDLDFVEETINLGARIQVNADAVIGKDGRRAKRFAKALMVNDMLHFVGSDAHDLRTRPPRMDACERYISRKMGGPYAHRVMTGNAEEIIMSGRNRSYE